MSGGTAGLGCCGPSVVTDVLVCPQPCQFAPLNCNDPTSIAIQAILDLKGAEGSTALEIYDEGLALCPDAGLTLFSIEDALAAGSRRGIFFRAISSVGATPTYMIIARMPLFNYQNRKYNRIPCISGSFWKPPPPSE